MITPVLQIILTRLWLEEKAKDHRHFSIDAYNELRKKGIFLDDFFQQQMEELKQWETKFQKRAESSGLALDVLHYHTTTMGTAESRKLVELRGIYQHQADVLEALIQQFKSLYLLSTIGKDQSALAHDTLAPVIQKELNESDKPGQRAARILMSKMIDYQLHPERTYIDEGDLALVEEGAAGMRMWTPQEQELIDKSQQRRLSLLAERKRNRNLKRILISVISLLILLASAGGTLWWQSKKQFEVDQIAQQASYDQELDPTQALKKVHHALEKIDQSILPLDDQISLRTQHDIYRDNDFYQLLPIPLESDVLDLQVAQKSPEILLTNGSQVSIWKTGFGQTQNFVDSFPHPKRVTSVCYSKDEQMILTASLDPYIRLWRKNTNEEPEQFQGEQTFFSAAFSPDEQFIYGGTRSGLIYQWDRNQKIINSWQAHQKGVTTMAFDSTNQLLITGSFDSNIHIWDMRTGTKSDSLLYDGKGIISLDFDPINRRIIAGYLNGMARIWNLKDKSWIDLKGHTDRINDVTFSPDYKNMLTASLDQQIKLWDANGDLLKTYKGHKGWVQTLSFSPNGSYFASAGEDQTIKWWKRNSKTAMEFQHTNEVITTAFLPNELGIITANVAEAYWWNFNGEKVRTFKGHRGWIQTATASNDGQRFYTGSDDGTVIIWNSAGKQLYQFTAHKAPVYALALSPDHTTLASGGRDQRVLLWNQTGEIQDSLLHPNEVSEVTFSPDGEYLLTGCKDGVTRLWKDGLTAPREFRGSAELIYSVAFSPNGQLIAASGSNQERGMGIFSVWDLNGQLLFEKNDMLHAKEKAGIRISMSIAFSSDGQYFIVGTAGGTAQVFNLKGQLILTLNDIGKGEVYCASFAPENDRYILTSGMDGKVRLFVNPIQTPVLHSNSWYKLE